MERKDKKMEKEELRKGTEEGDNGGREEVKEMEGKVKG